MTVSSSRRRSCRSRLEAATITERVNMQANYRVAMVSANAYPVMGGTETHINEVAPRLSRFGFDVTVLTTDRSGDLPAEELVGGVSVRRVQAWPRDRDYYFAPQLYTQIVDGNWDLIHCQGYHTFVPLIAMLAAMRRGIPFVLTFHSGGHDSRVRNRLRQLQLLALRPLLSRASRLIAVSEWESRKFVHELHFSPARFATIPNGAAIREYSAIVDEESAPAVGVKGTLVLSVGRLEKYKGHQAAIAAFPHFVRLVPDARLRIVGSGPYEAELRRQVASLGLGEYVEIQGVDPRNRGEMAELLARADLVILLSEYESQGIAAMEALALGRPVLVAGTTALSDLARRGLASAVPPHASPEEVAGAMAQQLGRYPPTFIDLPTWDGCAELVAATYRQILNGETRQN